VKHIMLSLLVALVLVFPHLGAQVAALAAAVAVWAAGQPLLWAFAAGIAARPRLARRLARRLP
jgi:hypothetical protein